MKFTEISSLQNPKIKDAIRLRERSQRDKSGLFLIEGYRELLRALAAGQKITSLFFSPAHFLGLNEDALLLRASESGALLYACHKDVFQKISYRDRPDGLLGVGVQQPLNLAGLQKRIGNAPLLIVAEAIEKPGNLGTILRSSDGVGADGVIVCDRCTDVFNPNVVRASVGTLFTLPVCEASSQDTLDWLKENRIAIVAATPSATLEYTDIDMTQGIAIAVGTEQLGLSEAWMQQADLTVRIPMQGVADSLNVATATTLLLYEALRQRKIKPCPKN